MREKRAVVAMQGMGFERVLGGVCAPAGFLAAGVSCGIKGDERMDLALLYSEKPASAAGVFTTNEVKAAPVLVTRERLAGGGPVRAVVVNSGNANAMMGEKGMEDAAEMAATCESVLGIAGGEALVASTGLIGEFLPMHRIVPGIEKAASELSTGGNTDAAKAIMTTDTYPKELAVEMEMGGKVVRLGAMAKGSGMIQPNMATMIVVMTTDVALEAGKMRSWLADAVEWSFNRITVDGDQSTNDMVLMLANGASRPDDVEWSRDDEELFFRALCWLTANLALALVKDGEGATKIVRVVINGAVDDKDAVSVARAVANSNLVKCAFFGGLPLWGRIAAAAGNAGVALDPSGLEIFLGEYKVSAGGGPVPCDPADLQRILLRDEVEVTLNLGAGNGSAFYLTTDLTTRYVEINSSDKS